MTNQRRSQKDIDKLVRDNMGLVYYTAKKKSFSSMDASIDVEDCIASGVLGLCQAAARWDGKRRFSTYAVTYISGLMSRQMRDVFEGPRSMYQAAGFVRGVVKKLEANGHIATNSLVADTINASDKRPGVFKKGSTPESVEKLRAAHSRRIPIDSDLIVDNMVTNNCESVIDSIAVEQVLSKLDSNTASVLRRIAQGDSPNIEAASRAVGVDPVSVREAVDGIKEYAAMTFFGHYDPNASTPTSMDILSGAVSP